MRENTSPTPSRRRRILLAMDLKSNADRLIGCANYAHEAGWIFETRLLAFRTLGRQKEYLRSVRFDGVLSCADSNDVDLQRFLNRIDVPVVDWSRDYRKIDLPRVYTDDLAAGRLAAEHLIHLGLKRLLFYSHTIDRIAAPLRRDGFCNAARAKGGIVNEIWWDSRKRMPKSMERINWLAQRLQSMEHPVGVMAANDVIASDVLEAAERAGLRVPEDVAVVGADNELILAEYGAVPLTSVDTDRKRVGYEAAALLTRLIEGESPPVGPILVPPAGVVERRSTRVLAVSDVEVVRAVRFIQEHFRESIGVSDIVAATFLSRRRMQDRFKEAIGHSIAHELVRQRMEFAKHLLTQTTHKIEMIARMAGFMGTPRMSKVFRRETGTTPHAYRLRHR